MYHEEMRGAVHRVHEKNHIMDITVHSKDLFSQTSSQNVIGRD